MTSPKMKQVHWPTQWPATIPGPWGGHGLVKPGKPLLVPLPPSSAKRMFPGEMPPTDHLSLTHRTSMGFLAEIWLSQLITVIVAGLVVAAVLQ
jgi:hypothetical protein